MLNVMRLVSYYPTRCVLVITQHPNVITSPILYFGTINYTACAHIHNSKIILVTNSLVLLLARTTEITSTVRGIVNIHSNYEVSQNAEDLLSAQEWHNFSSYL